MSHSIIKTFTDHPAKVGESYLQHFGVAASFAFWLSIAAGAAIIHALVPALCESTASEIIGKLHKRMATRH